MPITTGRCLIVAGALAVVGALSGTALQLRAAFAAALSAYRDRDFRAAGEGFGRCLEIDPNDGPSRLFIDRLRRFQVGQYIRDEGPAGPDARMAALKPAASVSAAAITAPSENSVSSSNGRPMSWSPSGKPCSERPAGYF